MSDDNQIEIEALAAVGEMLLFDKARGDPIEAERILRSARLFARSERVIWRLGELCIEVGRDAAWHESIVEELQDLEDVRAIGAIAELEAGTGTKVTSLDDLMADLHADDERETHDKGCATHDETRRNHEYRYHE